ncbi:pentatricopeptide repeat-containing protein At2g22410, mitochondrial-like [Magnolia sinica]|uniref:pentatricopeptide repeat-containing protein At2g22410, mitochondrial-like n=1 Tax=Magnolia sinica TaxID=86752 RepID=UPI002657BCF4|nr:pentatricopeptide repeat-containing protein At2g22410, mitochondrial-like [Magnolia sinica]
MRHFRLPCSQVSLNGAIENARHVFDKMPERDIVAWNAMLSGYAQSGLPQAALELFQEMQIANFRPNEVTLVSALSACSQLGSLAVGKWIHAYIDRHDSIRATSTLNNSLAHMYAKCGRLDAAFRVFVERRPRNLESWNTMLTSFAIHGCGSAALSLFSQMMRMGLTPDRISFVGLLMACSHGGMIDHATRCFDCMNRVYGIEPKSEHYGCMVDVLSRGGFLEEAQLLIDSMPFEPDAYVWGALLGGCLTHKNYELGLHTAKCLLELEPDEESRHIALLNLHAMSGKREDATMVRNTMIDMGVNKSSGSSKIEINGISVQEDHFTSMLSVQKRGAV